jgi:hypothetical protein
LACQFSSALILTYGVKIIGERGRKLKSKEGLANEQGNV